jgi:hypothetical protein
MSKCHCVECNCSIEGLHERADFVCPFCKAGNHIRN